MNAVYSCCDERRRDAVLAQTALNGIDYLEVVDLGAIPVSDRQRILRIHFVNSPAPPGLTTDNVLITGGERITLVQADNVTYDGDVLVVHLTAAGDYSPYVFRLIQGGGSTEPLAVLDPLLAEITFSFKVECPSDLDCRIDRTCPPEPLAAPEIDYLAKDYDSFRRLMLDRMALLIPDWFENSPADLGITIVEVLAYVADHLSYQQDAVATEAYLRTARRRVSVRRHARLVDYFMHDGSNARVWAHFEVGADDVTVPRSTQLLTRAFDGVPRVPPNSSLYDQALREGALVFETMHDETMFVAHNRIELYTWGALNCCLPAGATSATLTGKLDKLSPGDVLIFVEERGPHTGRTEDADQTHRHAVRLTSVKLSQDPLGGRFLSPPNNNPVDVTEIAWAADDALPFPLCISSTTDEAHGQKILPSVSAALGNVVLADHGRKRSDEPLGVVPEPTLYRAVPPNGDRCTPIEPSPIQPRFRPTLLESPLTQVATVTRTRIVGGSEDVEVLPFDPEAPASAAMKWEMADVLPAISIQSTGTIAGAWAVQSDLLESDPLARDFVAEVDDDGATAIRFGDGEYGMRPDPGTSFTADYRTGNGTHGNIGANTLAHIVSNDSGLVSVTNPLAARGGRDPETSEEVRVAAPVAFRTLERAVTEDDWAVVTERQADVARAAATFRWTGSWHTVFDTVERTGAKPIDDVFRSDLRTGLERYRVVGHDLEIDAPRFVSLDVEMRVCVLPDYFRADVKRALLAVFNDRTTPDGKLGMFNAEQFGFGQPVYLSRFYAAAQAIEGVAEVVITKFERQGSPSTEAFDLGYLKIDRLEIARLENDPDFPEHGVFVLDMRGGK